MAGKIERLARTIVADFFLYNQDKIDRGLLNDTFFELLGGELEDSVRFFEEHGGKGNQNIFWDTLFNKLMQREARLVKGSAS
jgi:hypothetical protein